MISSKQLFGISAIGLLGCINVRQTSSDQEAEKRLPAWGGFEEEMRVSSNLDRKVNGKIRNLNRDSYLLSLLSLLSV
jgi:hypothetical protein